MRIISAFIVLSIALAVNFPKTALAAEKTLESNETKTNFKINDNSIFRSDVFVNKGGLILAYEPSASEVVLPEKEEKILEKTEGELKREKALERYAEKRKSAVYPKGKFIINASAYTAAADECGKSDGITASGLMVKEKETIACPPQFPMGTKIKISNMGIYICQDRGGAIKGNHVDIYMKTKKEAFAFGRRNLEAEVIL